jgi:hypothetical protein
MGQLVLAPDLSLPLEAVARTFAIMGQRGSGKSSLAAVMAEEMCRESLPWVALDPVGIWWGLRCLKDGSPSPFPVVVFGGPQGDLPFEKGQGRKIAEACVRANVFAVIDLSRESKTTWRTIVKDFCHALQDLRPDHPRHVFLEEAPEFVPQRASHQLGAECKEIVERLVRLGRNWGYGATVLSQRPATVDKDVLSQCENLFVMRTSGPHDRKALGEWIEANAQNHQVEKCLDSLASLSDGESWFWSPQWMDIFKRVGIRQRLTFHPGQTRKVGAIAKSVELADVKSFVEKVRRELTKVQVVVHAEKETPNPDGVIRTDPPRTVEVIPSSADVEKLTKQRDDNFQQIHRLQGELKAERDARRDADARLKAARELLRPQYDTLKALFEAIAPSGNGSASAVDRRIYEPWLAKAGKAGCRRLLEVLIERPELKRVQLATLGGVSFRSSTFRNYLSWLKRNGLIETPDFETVKLNEV